MDFKDFDPCMYKGNINCEDCSDRKECDMKQGRCYHKDYYEAGQKDGKKQKENNNG